MVLEMGVVSYGGFHGSTRTCILNHAFLGVPSRQDVLKGCVLDLA